MKTNEAFNCPFCGEECFVRYLPRQSSFALTCERCAVRKMLTLDRELADLLGALPPPKPNAKGTGVKLIVRENREL